MYKLKQCGDKDCKNDFKQFNSLQKYCSTQCKKKNVESGKPKKTTRINPVSKKRRVEVLQYKVDRIVFLGKPENQVCPVTKKQTTEIHHKKGRIGSLYLDQRFWLAVSSEGHKWIHENDKLAREKGWLLNRNSNQ